MRRRRRLLLTSASIAVLTALSAGSAATGNTSSDWTVGSNWSGNAVPTTTSDVTINSTAPNPTVLGVSGAAIADSRNILVGTGGGSGSLTIQNGSMLTSNATNLVFIGQDGGLIGFLRVTGPYSQWTLLGAPGINSLHIGGVGGTGTMQVIEGATASQTGDIAIGRLGGTGSLLIASGGVVTTGRDAFIGRLAGGIGTATVDGVNSQWTVAGDVYVGNGGTGTLNINNGAQVTVGSTLIGNPGGSGTLNINNGTVTTRTLQGGAGARQVNFDNAVLQATQSNAAFINGFSGNELNLAAGGLTIDTGAFNVGTDAASAFSRTGGLTKTGGGTLTLRANNTYSGQTSGPNAMMTVSGTGSLLQTGSLTVSISGGSNATLNVLNGGVVRTTFGGAGIGGASSQTGTVKVDGAGSLLDLAGALNLGNAQPTISAFLNIAGGGTVRSATGTVGSAIPGSGTTEVNIAGAGSTWMVNGPLNLNGNGRLSSTVAARVQRRRRSAKVLTALRQSSRVRFRLDLFRHQCMRASHRSGPGGNGMGHALLQRP